MDPPERDPTNALISPGTTTGVQSLVIPRLSAEDIPTEAAELKDELAGLVPFAPIASVLIELDRRTGFLDCFTHAGAAKPRSPEHAQWLDENHRDIPGPYRTYCNNGLN